MKSGSSRQRVFLCLLFFFLGKRSLAIRWMKQPWNFGAERFNHGRHCCNCASLARALTVDRHASSAAWTVFLFLVLSYGNNKIKNRTGKPDRVNPRFCFVQCARGRVREGPNTSYPAHKHRSKEREREREREKGEVCGWPARVFTRMRNGELPTLPPFLFRFVRAASITVSPCNTANDSGSVRSDYEWGTTPSASNLCVDALGEKVEPFLRATLRRHFPLSLPFCLFQQCSLISIRSTRIDSNWWDSVGGGGLPAIELRPRYRVCL